MKGHEKLRVLVAKPGLDGHDVGAKVIVRALMEAGFDVTYTGLRKSPEEIVRVACDEDIDVLALSILSGSHIPICQTINSLLQNSGRGHMLWIVGGNIHRKDHEELKRLGVDAVFGVGSSPQSVVAYIRERVDEKRTPG